MDSINFKNVSFIFLLLFVLGVTFGAFTIIGLFEPSSMYTRLIYGEEEEK